MTKSTDQTLEDFFSSTPFIYHNEGHDSKGNLMNSHDYLKLIITELCNTIYNIGYAEALDHVHKYIDSLDEKNSI